jgi:hypothetical protein
LKTEKINRTCFRCGSNRPLATALASALRGESGEYHCPECGHDWRVEFQEKIQSLCSPVARAVAACVLLATLATAAPIVIAPVSPPQSGRPLLCQGRMPTNSFFQLWGAISNNFDLSQCPTNQLGISFHVNAQGTNIIISIIYPPQQ